MLPGADRVRDRLQYPRALNSTGNGAVIGTPPTGGSAAPPDACRPGVLSRGHVVVTWHHRLVHRGDAETRSENCSALTLRAMRPVVIRHRWAWRRLCCEAQPPKLTDANRHSS